MMAKIAMMKITIVKSFDLVIGTNIGLILEKRLFFLITFTFVVQSNLSELFYPKNYQFLTEACLKLVKFYKMSLFH